MYDVSASVEYCGAVELLWCEVWALCVSVLGYGLGLELCIGAHVLRLLPSSSFLEWVWVSPVSCGDVW